MNYDKLRSRSFLPGMSLRHGFTLIELLVVVLIIGILAAIALPKYRFAVEKSRSTEGVILLNTMIQAAQRYYLERGVYPGYALDQFDIQLPAVDGTLGHSQYFSISAMNNGNGYVISIARRSGDIFYRLYAAMKPDGTVKRYCGASAPIIRPGTNVIVDAKEAPYEGGVLCKILTGGKQISGDW